MRILIKIFTALLLIAAVLCGTAKAENFLANKPDFLTPCFMPDPDFHKCFVKNFQAIFHEWKDGIPGLKTFGSIDPLYVKRVAIAQDTKNSVALNTEMMNVMLTGVSKMIVKDISFNPKTLVLKVNMFMPKLRFDADYKLNGRILNLALNGNGKSVFEIENLSVFINMQLKLRDEYGYTFTDIKKLSLKITDVGGLHVHFDNLFNGQKDLEDSTNFVLNENWRDFYEVLNPAVSEAVEVIMNDRLSKAFSFVPANFLIADIPSAAAYSG